MRRKESDENEKERVGRGGLRAFAAFDLLRRAGTLRGSKRAGGTSDA